MKYLVLISNPQQFQGVSLWVQGPLVEVLDKRFDGDVVVTLDFDLSALGFPTVGPKHGLKDRGPFSQCHLEKRFSFQSYIFQSELPTNRRKNPTDNIDMHCFVDNLLLICTTILQSMRQVSFPSFTTGLLSFF